MRIKSLTISKIRYQYFLYILIITITIFMAKSAKAHGLNKYKGESIFIKGEGDLLIKILVFPKNIEFFRQNRLTVSIINTTLSEHFYGDVKASLTMISPKQEKVKLAEDHFKKGLFKTKAFLKRAGKYNLNINIENKKIKTEFNFIFKIKDERTIPLIVLACTAGFLIVLIFSIIFLKRRDDRQ